ncbi:NfeD family protein [Alkalicoccobacillus porphyridii]|uniref:Nodulation protein NfeD n=1 Tax=Alkalicoccobacillus porphyridii TaxID=2597270 RepID=A0A553ZZ60_9BACI|nr:NfeD family protein [Alkalicoccobacillus porphyridii]TSB46728.1 nodulation protein NfeD [Alkalicoccobacillus porphyridii]
MEWLDTASIGFIVIFLGTLFLFGELLVKARGLFALLGIGMTAMYFLHHLTGDSGFWVIILYLIGIVLIILDGKLFSDGTVGIIGVILMIVGLAIPAPTLVYGILVAMAFVLGAFGSLFFLKVFTRRQMWSKLTFKDRLTSERGYNSINVSYKELVGKEGKTMNALRPTGTITIDGQPYSATSGGQWIEAEAEITVTSVDGTRILVAKVENKEE